MGNLFSFTTAFMILYWKFNFLTVWKLKLMIIFPNIKKMHVAKKIIFLCNFRTSFMKSKKITNIVILHPHLSIDRHCSLKTRQTQHKRQETWHYAKDRKKAKHKRLNLNEKNWAHLIGNKNTFKHMFALIQPSLQLLERLKNK